MLWYFALLLIVCLDFGVEWLLNKLQVLNGNSKWQTLLKFATKYRIISIIAFVFISTFKAYSVGSDTFEYLNYYNLAKGDPNRLFKNPITNKFEFGFTFLNSLLVLNHLPFRVMFFIISTFVAIVLVLFVNKVSVNKLMSFILFIALGFFAQSLSAYRQIVAIALTLLAISKLVDKKWVAASLLILLGATFHISALLALGIIPLRFIKPKLWFVGICFGVVIAGSFAMPQILKLLEILTPLDYYTKYFVVLNYYLGASDVLNTLYSVALILLFVFLYVFKNKLKLDERDKEFYNFYLLIFMVVPLFRIVGFIANMPQLLNRLSMYFFVVLIVLIPLFVKGLQHNKKLYVLANVMVYVVAIAYMIYLYAIKNTCGIYPFAFGF